MHMGVPDISLYSVLTSVLKLVRERSGCRGVQRLGAAKPGSSSGERVSALRQTHHKPSVLKARIFASCMILRLSRVVIIHGEGQAVEDPGPVYEAASYSGANADLDSRGPNLPGFRCL